MAVKSDKSNFEAVMKKCAEENDKGGERTDCANGPRVKSDPLDYRKVPKQQRRAPWNKPGKSLSRRPQKFLREKYE